MAETGNEHFFKQDSTDVAPTDTGSGAAAEANVEWKASEFVHHDKSAGWYTKLALFAVIVGALVYWLTRDFVSVAVVIGGAILLAVYGARQPRELEYKLDNRGVQIGQKYHSYGEFRSFSIMPEGAFSSVIFMPLKRFAVTTTIYFAPEDETKITDILTDCLPFEEHRLDAVDRLIKSIRF